MAEAALAREAGLGGELLDRLTPQPPDPLLALIGAFRADPRPTKIDVGVGIYKDARGATPVFAAVKEAERRLFEAQTTKAYLGPEGDIGFFNRLRPIVLGDAVDRERVAGLQTPGGTGALRLAAELVAAAKPDARVLVGLPTWANHPPIFGAARLSLEPYPYFDVGAQELPFDRMTAALERGRPGDVVLLQGCCHNPVGADLDPAQWDAVADIVERRGLVPLIDLAYQGLGAGMQQDARGARALLARCEEALVAYSCDKNFGLYRERTGALFAISRTRAQIGAVQSNLLSLARANWSMPPDHGAAVVRVILETPELERGWSAELDGMKRRIADIRVRLSRLHPMLKPLAGQFGMFSTLPLTPPEVERLRAEHGIYMASSGRINVAGLTPETVARFAAAVGEVRPAD